MTATVNGLYHVVVYKLHNNFIALFRRQDGLRGA
jgi:hypothetical protein